LQALSIALLFAAAALVAANGTVNVNVPNPHAVVNSVSESVSALHKSLSAAANVDLSKCECAKKCDDKKQEYCKTTTEMVEECADVETTKDFIECKTKCFTADNVIEVNVPTIDLNNKGSEYPAAAAACRYAFLLCMLHLLCCKCLLCLHAAARAYSVLLFS
jgi:hypothetical protein